MKNLKKFTTFNESSTDFTVDDITELDDIFKDFSFEYGIKEVDNFKNLPTTFIDTEENQYFISQDRMWRISINLRLFTNSEEIIETIKDNFIPQIKSLGWAISEYSLQKDGVIKRELEDGRCSTTPLNLNLDYTEVIIKFRKKG